MKVLDLNQMKVINGGTDEVPPEDSEAKRVRFKPGKVLRDPIK